MNFGRAALLGLSAGECDAAYPRCPRDESQLLNYLNTHRGGFFRFFNGGSTFGGFDDDLLQTQASQQNPQQANQGLNLLALQALAETLGGSGSGSSFNLNNLFSSQRPAVPQQPQTQTYQGSKDQNLGGFLSALKPSTLSDVVSNLLTGVIGNRFSRQTMRNKRSVYSSADEGHSIQRRIVNLKDNVVRFVEAEPQQQHKNTLFDELEKPFTFSNDNRISSQQDRQHSYALKFPHDIPPAGQGSFVSSSDVLRRLKALFPDVDSFGEQFTQNLLRLMMSEKGREILAAGQRPISNLSTNRYPATTPDYAGISSSNSINYNYYNRQPQSALSGGNRSNIVYVTNGQGQIEYTLNELTGEKTRYL